MSWKQEAIRLFFESGQSIVSISSDLGKSRQTVGDYLKQCVGFHEEKERRKAENTIARKVYKREWDSNNRLSRIRNDRDNQNTAYEVTRKHKERAYYRGRHFKF